MTPLYRYRQGDHRLFMGSYDRVEHPEFQIEGILPIQRFHFQSRLFVFFGRHQTGMTMQGIGLTFYSIRSASERLSMITLVTVSSSG